MDKPPPKGRGAALLARRLQMQKEEKTVGVEPEATQQTEEPPKPRGRAALLQKLREKRIAKPGIEPETQPEASTSQSSIPEPQKQMEEISKATSEISIVEKEPAFFKGEHGKKLQLTANYIKLNLQKDMGVFEFEVKFLPELDAKNKRCKAVYMVVTQLGLPKVFDGGNVLYLPKKITDTSVNYTVNIPNPDGEQEINIKIIYKRKKKLSDRECLHLYNVLFKRIMHKLLYTQMNRNYFDTNHKYLIPQHKLEVYPGFAITVDEVEDGLMLCLDTQHKVLRTQNAYDLLTELRSSNADPSRFKELATSNIVGSCVFTRYNNKTYTIQDIAWNMSPKDTFLSRDGTSVSFIDYYKNQHNIIIKDLNQPLLINRKNLKVSGSSEKVERMVCLIPEISYLTGLTDSMRSDFKVMKDVAQYTRITPGQRVEALRKYLDNVRRCAEAQQILADWGLKIGTDTIPLTGRQLDNEVIYFGNDRQFQTNDNGDWSRPAGENPLPGPVDMANWIVFYTERDKKYAKDFSDMMVRLGSVMGCRINQPKGIRLPDDRTDSYMKACQEYINDTVQIVVFICPTMRSDRYSLIKKICCTQIPVASQVINSRTLSNPSKVRTIVQKIALQMSCKLGGTIWTLRFPFKNWMICGMDVYHGGPRDSSVCGLVCSLNESISRWYSMAIFQDKELGDFLKIPFTKALQVWRSQNGVFPSKIVMVRDGISDGQLDHCLRYEVEQLESVLRELQCETKLCFIVVQKRINTRVFSLARNGNSENPPPGTILDHTVTRRYLHDFFLVPQNVRQGTVNPTHYIVLHDQCELKPDHIQRLCYKLCHLYYNWSGTIRVPAPCQYAHKLAQLVGQHIKKDVDPKLLDKLFYL